MKRRNASIIRAYTGRHVVAQHQVPVLWAVVVIDPVGGAIVEAVLDPQLVGPSDVDMQVHDQQLEQERSSLEHTPTRHP